MPYSSKTTFQFQTIKDLWQIIEKQAADKIFKIVPSNKNERFYKNKF